MSALSVFYALLFYAATLILVVGVAARCLRYARTPQPLKIPIPPAPTTLCEYDHVPNGAVDGADFGVFAANFGRAPGPACQPAPGGSRGIACPTPGAVCP